MDAPSAAAEIHEIRRLMERAALYRRALAPALLTAGLLGTLAALAGALGPAAWTAPLNTAGGFFLLWLSVGAVVAVAALVLMRIEAVRNGEPFWTAPARRVAAAAIPGWIAALAALAALANGLPHDEAGGRRLAAAAGPIWAMGHGLALHAAGFHTLRGVRWLGLAFLAAGAALAFLVAGANDPTPFPTAHLAMGAIFGLGHLAAAVALRTAEHRSAA